MRATTGQEDNGAGKDGEEKKDDNEKEKCLFGKIFDFESGHRFRNIKLIFLLKKRKKKLNDLLRLFYG